MALSPDAGGTGSPGTCKIVVNGNSLICTDDTGKKTCGLTVTIPTLGLAIA